MISKENIGKIIRKARILKGYSVSELAREVNMTSSQVSDIETGRNLLGLKTLEKFVRELGIPYAKIFNDKEREDVFKMATERFSKFAKILDLLEKDVDLVDFLEYYSKNKDKIKQIKYKRILKSLCELEPEKQNEVLTHFKRIVKMTKEVKRK